MTHPTPTPLGPNPVGADTIWCDWTYHSESTSPVKTETLDERCHFPATEMVVLRDKTIRLCWTHARRVVEIMEEDDD